MTIVDPASVRGRRGSGRNSAFTVGAGVLLMLTIVVVNAGGLVSRPLTEAGVDWPIHLGIAAAGFLVSLGTRGWRSWAVLLSVGFWVMLSVWMPHALSVTPDPKAGFREAVSLGYAATLSVGALLLGCRAGLRWWRCGWALGLLLTGAIAGWELTTNNHLWATPDRPFPFPEPVAVATYVNPNNFGIVLLSMLVAALAWRSSTRIQWQRMALGFTAVVAATLVLVSQSRAATLGLLLVAALDASRALSSRPGVVRQVLVEHRAGVSTAVAGVMVALIAVFAFPPLATHNPVLRMIEAATMDETGRSDLLRVTLARASLDYLRESKYLGTGAGSFETLFLADPERNVGKVVNLHNAFLELLTQYGVACAGVLGALLLLLVVLAWRTRISASLRPQVAIVRTEMMGHLVAFAALGFTASSSLALPVWWLMLANACACAAALQERTRRTRTRDDERRRAAERQAETSGRLVAQSQRRVTESPGAVRIDRRHSRR